MIYLLLLSRVLWGMAFECAACICWGMNRCTVRCVLFCASFWFRLVLVECVPCAVFRVSCLGVIINISFQMIFLGSHTCNRGNTETPRAEGNGRCLMCQVCLVEPAAERLVDCIHWVDLVRWNCSFVRSPVRCIAWHTYYNWTHEWLSKENFPSNWGILILKMFAFCFIFSDEPLLCLGPPRLFIRLASFSLLFDRKVLFIVLGLLIFHPFDIHGCVRALGNLLGKADFQFSRITFTRNQVCWFDESSIVIGFVVCEHLLIRRPIRFFVADGQTAWYISSIFRYTNSSPTRFNTENPSMEMNEDADLRECWLRFRVLRRW